MLSPEYRKYILRQSAISERYPVLLFDPSTQRLEAAAPKSWPMALQGSFKLLRDLCSEAMKLQESTIRKRKSYAGLADLGALIFAAHDWLSFLDHDAPLREELLGMHQIPYHDALQCICALISLHIEF